MLFKRLLVALALLFPSALALAQGTQFPAGTVWGNNTAAVRPGQVSTLTALFDRAFGSTSGTILERAGAWGLTSTPTLGANGGIGGQLTLKGSTSGAAAIRVAAAAGTGTIFQLPPDNGTNTYVLQTNGSGVTSWVAQASGSGTVTSVTPGSGLVTSVTASCSQTAFTTVGTLYAAQCVNAQTGTSYAIVDGDRAKLITASNAAAQAYTIAQAGAASAFQAGWYVDIQNNSVNSISTVTVTPSTSTIRGATSYTLQAGQSVRIVSDGANYQILALGGAANPINMVAAGIDNTGATDVSTAVQAIVTANTAGNCLFFPSGAYTFHGITSSNPVCVTGVGTGAGPGTASQANSYDTQFFINSSTADLFTITSIYPSRFENFQCNVPVANRPMTAGSCIHLIGTGSGTQANSRIRNVGFTNVFRPIEILRPSWPAIENCYFDTWGGSAIYMTTSSGIEGSMGFIAHNYIFGGSGYSSPAIYSEVGYADIHDNEILGGNFGINFNIKNHPAGYLKVHDNTIENFGTYGVYAQTGDGSTAAMLMVQNNEFSDNANTPWAAIATMDSTVTNEWLTDVVITGNTSRSTTASGGRHIFLGAGKNVVISQNVFDELGANSPQGIYVGGVSTNASVVAPISISDNTFIGTFSAKYVMGAGTILAVVKDTVNGTTIANLPGSLGDGSQFFTTDGSPASSPCTGSSTGSMAFRQNGAWKCF